MNQRLIRTLMGFTLTLLMLIPLALDRTPELIKRFELDLYDIRLRHSLSNEPDPRIVIVDIDEKSLGSLGQWPWQRDILANLLDQLFEQYGVAVVGFDMLFSEADSRLSLQQIEQFIDQDKPLTDKPALLSELSGITPDAVFAESLANRSVVMGYVFDPSKTNLAVGQLAAPILEDSPLLNQLPIPEASGFIGNLPAYQRQTPWGGFFDNPKVDTDGVYRRVPTIQRYQNHYYPSLALAMLLTLYEEDNISVLTETDATGDKHALVAIDASGLKIPVDENGSALVPYRGPQGSFSYISAVDVIEGKAPIEVLEGTLVLVGTSAAGLLDLRVTPLGNRYPGVEVHANLLSGMLDENFRHQPDYTKAIELLQILISGLLLSVLLPRLSALSSAVVMLSWVLALTVVNFYAWNELLWVIPIGYSLVFIALLFLLQQASGYFFETRNIVDLSKKFGQYIPPEVVDELSQQQPVQLSGEQREMTVFFSDVRDFTQISEQLTPQQLARLMNIYLSEMTAAIHQTRGTVDKYIGDAVMAFWGAPLPDNRHSYHALNAALDMLERLPALNTKLTDENLPALQVGMGINSGVMNVGNMGSSFRMAYTVMGDAVNLASRLEGLSKFYGCPLLVSEETAAQAPEFTYRKIDKVRVKGRHEPIWILEPIALTANCSEQEKVACQQFEAAITLYGQQRWNDAELAFINCREKTPLPNKAKTIAIYLDRISVYRHDPPNEPWDAVFTHTEK